MLIYIFKKLGVKMEFKRIGENEKETYQKYLDLLYDVNGSIDKVSIGVLDDIRYVVANGEKTSGIILDDGSEMKPFFISSDDSVFQTYGTLEYIYNIVDSEMKEVIKTNGEGTEETRVSYLPATENYPRNVLEYSQYKGDINSLLEMRYDVTMRKNAALALSYSYYQLPDDIRFQYLKYVGPFAKRKTHYYGRSIDEENVYYSPLLVINSTPFGQKSKTFDGKKLMEKFIDLGFKSQIPSEISSLINGTNEEYKTLRLIDKEYKNFIKGQN